MADEGRRGELSGLEQLLRAVADQPEGAPAEDFDDFEEGEEELESASGLLSLMIEREWLELTSSQIDPALVKAVAGLLNQPGSPERQAETMMEMLIDHDAVEEVYASEEDLEGLLAQW